MSTPSRFKKDKEIIAEYESQVKDGLTKAWHNKIKSLLKFIGGTELWR